MQFFRYRLLFLIIISCNSYSDCLNSNFSTQISHKSWPLGFFKKILNIQKMNCTISVQSIQFKYLKKKWEVDICRSPIHIKFGLEDVEVFKRKTNCHSSNTSEFCKKFMTIDGLIQDDGLIFASGFKEDLNSDHGKVNCVHKLMRTYLNNGIVYGKNIENDKIIKIEKEVTPVSNPESSENSKNDEGEGGLKIPIPSVKEDKLEGSWN